MPVYSFVRKNDHNDVVFAQDINELQAAVEVLSVGGGGGGMTGFTVAADSGPAQSVTDGNTLTIVGGTGIDSVASATDTVTLAIDSTVATLTGSQTLTNKTLTTPIIASLTNAQHSHTNSAGGGQITDAALSSAIGIAKGGTGQTTAQNARNALLPSQANNKFLKSDGTDVTFQYAPISPVFPWKSGRWYSLQALFAANFGNSFTVTTNEIYATPLWVPEGSGAVDRVGVAVKTGIAASTARLMYHAPGSDGHPGALLFDFGTVSTATSGDKEITIAQTLPPGPGWITIVCSAAISLYQYDALYSGIPGNANQSGSDCSPHRANGGTTAPNPFGTSGIAYLGDKYPRVQVRAA